MKIINWCLSLGLLSGIGNTQTLNNILSPGEKYQGFSLMFDGTLQSVRDNFVTYQKDGQNVTTLPAIIQLAPDKSYFFDNGSGEDIRSKKSYADFELRLDYRISDNAGIYARANLSTDHIYDNSIEYPLYNGTPTSDKMNAPGAAYDIVPPLVNNYKNFASGQWNTVVIRYVKDSLYHWHNNALTVKLQLQSTDYNKQIAVSKWKDQLCMAVEVLPSGCAHNNPYRKEGYIGFQTGYPGMLYLRNVRVGKYPYPQDTSTISINKALETINYSITTLPGRGLEVNVPGSEPFQVTVFSLGGKVVPKFAVTEKSRSFTYHTPVAGIYLVSIKSQGKTKLKAIAVN